MTDNKKKCWREKVTAEITLTHMQQVARELGSNMSPAEVAAFFNCNGRAQELWTRMMQAGEEHIKSVLEAERFSVGAIKHRPAVHASMLH